ncbi:MAG: hypothetical protein GF309_12370 [Candidatus Lokiarchaeota archaeon]|jgi:hypothetical protein|nr:hypothetical protein [Candidatus Lokiarchaeota archaeon]
MSVSKEVIWQADAGTFLRVFVKPRSGKRNLLEEMTKNTIQLNLKSSARRGKANKELLKRVSKVLGISSGDISLVAGQRSRDKTLLIPSMEPDEIIEAFESLKEE